MGLFRPFDEEAKLIDHKININAMAKHDHGRGVFKTAQDYKNRGYMSNPAQKLSYEKKHALAGGDNGGKTLNRAANFASGRIPKNESAAALLGISNEEFYELNEGNCDSDTCKCKGGTCPVSVTDGISTSSYAAKKLANAGSNNQTDMNAVVPNAEYSRRNDAFFIGDGDSPETSKTNIPGILAAKTAGGSPHGWTTDNGINGTGSNVFKLRKLRDDDDGPNG